MKSKMKTTSIWDHEKWDNLIILDTCRYDEFKRMNIIPGTLKKVHSIGYQTQQWAQATFEPRLYDDIVYWTQNPWLSEEMLDIEHPGLKFHKTYSMSSLPAKYIEEVINPQVLANMVTAYRHNHEGKKHIIHFIKPHHPYSNKASCTGLAYRYLKGEFTDEELLGFYRENLRSVLDVLPILLRDLDGLTVVTADHAELLGDDDLWGHGPTTLDVSNLDKLTIIDSPEKREHPKLREVPWFIPESSE